MSQPTHRSVRRERESDDPFDVDPAFITSAHLRRRRCRRHAQVSEIKFTFDGNKPSGERVVADSVTVAGEPLDREKEYVVACLDLAASGKARAGARAVLGAGCWVPPTGTRLRKTMYRLQSATIRRLKSSSFGVLVCSRVAGGVRGVHPRPRGEGRRAELGPEDAGAWLTAERQCPTARPPQPGARVSSVCSVDVDQRH